MFQTGSMAVARSQSPQPQLLTILTTHLKFSADEKTPDTGDCTGASKYLDFKADTDWQNLPISLSEVTHRALST